MRISLLLAALMGFAFCPACSTDNNERRGEHNEREGGEHDGERGEHGSRERGEHGREGGEHGGGEGGEEESGTELALTQKYDKTRRGAHLVLAYNATTNSFDGTVKNTTDATLERVRVEVHLSNGKELGPTKPMDLAPGAQLPVSLKAESKNFERWTAHPEVGSGEHR